MDWFGLDGPHRELSVSKRRVSFGFSAWFLVAGGAFACGSLNNGAIEVVDSDDEGSGATSGSGGKSTSGGDTNTGGTPEPNGGSPDGFGGEGDGGEPPIVISDDPPKVVSVSPENAADDIEPNTRVVIEFSESLDEASLDGAIVVKDGDEEVDAKLSFAGTKATLTFPQRLDLITTYSVNVSTDVTDLAGIALETAFSSTFKVREGKWGKLVTLSNAGTSPDSYPFPAPVFDARGNALTVWSQSATAQGPKAIWARVYNAAKGTWGTSQQISTAATACNLPSVAINQDGAAVVAWVQREGNFSRVFARRFLSGAWEAAPQRVDISDSSSVPHITTAVTETGDSHVLWQYYSTYRYVAGNVANGAGAWNTEDAYISGSFDNLSGPGIAFNPDGSGFASWVGSNGTSASVMRVARYLPATGWGNIETIATGAGAIVGNYSAPNLAVDASGNVMAAFRRTGDVITTRFTKATGWSAIAVADGAGTGTIPDWAPRLASHGDDFFVHWHQNVGNIANAFANRWTAGAWGTAAVLLSNGDTSVAEWSETAFGLDRHGNGLATWAQGADVRFARLVAADKKWAADALIATLEVKPASGPTDQRGAVAANGMGAVIYSNGYPYYERHDTLFAAIFE